MKYTAFVIKVNTKGEWKYYYKRANGETGWDDTVYGATKFNNRGEAEDLLNDKMDNEFWGGIFQIEECFISK